MPLQGNLKNELVITIYFHCVQLGDAIVRAVAFGRNPADQPQRLSLTGNLTDGQVANALIAGIALAAKSCGPPNHLSSSRWGPVLLPCGSVASGCGRPHGVLSEKW